MRHPLDSRTVASRSVWRYYKDNRKPVSDRCRDALRAEKGGAKAEGRESLGARAKIPSSLGAKGEGGDLPTTGENGHLSLVCLSSISLVPLPFASSSISRPPSPPSSRELTPPLLCTGQSTIIAQHRPRVPRICSNESREE